MQYSIWQRFRSVRCLSSVTRIIQCKMSMKKEHGVGVARPGQEIIAILGAGDFDVAIAGEFLVHEDSGIAGGIEGLVEAGVNRPASRRAAQRRACWARAMRSTAKTSRELTGR